MLDAITSRLLSGVAAGIGPLFLAKAMDERAAAAHLELTVPNSD